MRSFLFCSYFAFLQQVKLNYTNFPPPPLKFPICILFAVDGKRCYNCLPRESTERIYKLATICNYILEKKSSEDAKSATAK